MKKFCSLLLAAAMAVCTVTPLTAAADETAENAPAAAGQATAETAETSAPAETLELPVLAQPSALEQTDEQDQNPAQPSALEQLAAQFEALPTLEQMMSMSAEEMDEAMVSVGTALDAFNALSDSDVAAFQQAYPDLYQKVMVELNGALNANVSTMSLEPMQEEYGYLTLAGYSQEELQNFPVDEVLAEITDTAGDPLELPENPTSVWFYFPDESNREEFRHLNSGETIDLCDYNWSGYYSNTMALVMVVGNGDQTDADNSIRYNITIEMLPSVEQSVTFRVNRTVYKNVSPAYFQDELGMQGSEFTFENTTSDSAEGYSFYLYWNFYNVMGRYGYKVDVYPVANFLDYRDNGAELTGAITEDAFSGYTCTADFATAPTAETCRNASNVWVMTFTDKDTGELVWYYGLAFHVVQEVGQLEGQVLDADGATSLADISFTLAHDDSVSFNVNLDKEAEGDRISLRDRGTVSYGTSCYLPAGYPLEDNYTIKLEDTSWAKAIYLGYYTDEQSAVDAEAKDVKAELMTGFVTPLDNRIALTVVLDDGTTYRTSLWVYETYVEPDEPDEPDEPEEPVEPDVDPDFEIRDVYVGGSWKPNYVVDLAGGINLDTYYRDNGDYDVDGYQMIFVDCEMTSDDVKSIVPVFWVPNGVVVSSGELSDIVSGQTSLENAMWSDTMPNTVMLQVQVPGKDVKNYQVTFATKQTPESAAPADEKLLVAGPDERYINLNAENDYVHDILIANLSQEDMTGISVTLEDAVNVKLDEYWNINENMVLPSFTSTNNWYETDTGESYSSRYTTLSNIAKIRLLADGTGEISGTLHIALNGETVRDIKLTGVASAPHIVNTELPQGVKYVPYSCMIATDNMYTWNRTTFSIVKGELPEGLEFYGNTGEIYGTPQESGTFPLTIQVDFSSPRFEPATVDLELVVQDNTNENVYMATDDGYEIETPLGEEQGTDTYDFLLTDYDTDQLFVSTADIYGFQGLWLNGQELEPGVDYTVVRGSTRVTIYAQTFEDKGIMGGANTIAAEFRTTDGTNELKRTAQNFRLPDLSEEEDGSGGNGGNGGQGGSQGGNGGQGNSGGQDGSGNTATVTVTGSGSSAGQVSGQAAANAAGTANGSTVPQTSDSLPYTLCVVLALVSACGLAGLLIYRKVHVSE